MPFGSSLSALIRLAASLELEPEVALETLAIGQPRDSLAGSFYELETAGRWLCYTVNIAGEQVLVSASLLDGIDAPEMLLRTTDRGAEWLVVFHLICALEKAGVKSLARPIEAIIDGDPEHSWVIG
jgi:hypothetical protein